MPDRLPFWIESTAETENLAVILSMADDVPPVDERLWRKEAAEHLTISPPSAQELALTSLNLIHAVHTGPLINFIDDNLHPGDRPSKETERVLSDYRRCARRAFTGIVASHKYPPLPGDPVKQSVDLIGHIDDHRRATKDSKKELIRSLRGIGKTGVEVKSKSLLSSDTIAYRLMHNLGASALSVNSSHESVRITDAYHGDRRTFRGAVDTITLLAMLDGASDELSTLAAKGLWLNNHFGGIKDRMYKKLNKQTRLGKKKGRASSTKYP